MREFYIGSFEKVVAVMLILLLFAVVVGAISAVVNEGLLPGLFVLVFGSLYAVLVGGALYLILGIYHNTRRTAEAVEKLASN